MDKVTMQTQVFTWTFQSSLMTGLYIPAMTFLSTYHKQLYILVLFTILDFIFALAVMAKFREKFSIYRIWAGVITKMLTIVMPIIFYFFVEGVGVFDEALQKILPYGFSALIVVELYSILGHFYSLVTGEKPESVDLLSFLIKRLRSFLFGWIKAFKGVDNP